MVECTRRLTTFPCWSRRRYSLIYPSFIFYLLWSLIVLPKTSLGFLAGVVPTISKTATQKSGSLLMGLYDEPLPPRRPVSRGNETSKAVKNDDDDDDGEEGEEIGTRKLLFTFDEDGKEIRGLLPPLGRTLEYGIECYFEPNDRLVKNLVGKTDCHPSDAAWALEACQGDITEAWTRISMARRNILNDSTSSSSSSLSSEVSQLMAENEFEILKEERLEQERQARRNKGYLLEPGTPDERWLPTKNPNPVDDEPWFTG